MRFSLSKMTFVGLSLASVAACRGACAETADPARGASLGASPDSTSNAELASFVMTKVVYDCDGLEPPEPDASAGAAPGDALLLLAERLTEIPARHVPPENAWWDDFKTALVAASEVRTETMSVPERLALQNAALFLALSANEDGRRPHAREGSGAPSPAEEEHAVLDRRALALGAIALVKRLALPADQRPGSDEPDPTIEAWLGPRAKWIEGGPDAPFHQSVHSFTRLFRLVRTPSLHANFSQLVAVDAHGDPFVTAVIGSLEVRRGFDASARACVALPSPDPLRRGASAGLRAVRDLGTLPRSHFFSRDADGRLACNGCHAPVAASDAAPGAPATSGFFGPTQDIAPDDRDAALVARRAALLKKLREKLAPLWPPGL